MVVADYLEGLGCEFGSKIEGLDTSFNPMDRSWTYKSKHLRELTAVCYDGDLNPGVQHSLTDDK